MEMHYEIRDALQFPDYYGCNWDAFWDCLTDMIGEPVHIEVIGLDVIERKFGDSAAMIVKISKEFKHCYDDKYVDDIQIELVNGDTRVELT